MRVEGGGLPGGKEGVESFCALGGVRPALGVSVRDDGGPLGLGAVGLLEDVEVSEEDVRPRVGCERAHRPNLVWGVRC